MSLLAGPKDISFLVKEQLCKAMFSRSIIYGFLALNLILFLSNIMKS